MNRRRLLLLAGLTVGTLVAGCGVPDSNITGTVVSKRYEPAEYKTERTCKKKNDAGKCTQYQTRHVLKEGEEWEIVVRDVNGEDHEIDVSQDVYDKVQVGDRWPEWEATHG